MKKTWLILIGLFLLNINFSFCQDWVKLKNGLGVFGDVGYYVDQERNELYIVGYFFSDKEGQSLRGIAKWDGYNYTPVGGGGPLNPTVFSVARYKDVLYLSTWLAMDSTFTYDFFWASYNVQFNKLDTLEYGPIDNVTLALKVYDNILYAAGHFTKCGNDSTWGLCSYDGTNWKSLYTKPNPLMYDMANFIWYKDKFYVGGQFFEINQDSEQVNLFGTLEDGNLQKLGNGFLGTGNNEISEMVVFNDELYLAGYFLEAEGNPGNHIVRWDGTQYKKLGNGLDSWVSDIIVYKDNLYVAGNFTYADGVYSPKIARWDGEQWYAFNTDSIDGTIRDIEIFKGELYIGGNFYNIEGDTFNHVAKYNHQLPGEENELDIFINNPGEEIIINYEDTNAYFLLVNVSTVSGQQIREFTLTFQQGYIHESIPITGLAAGVYIVEAITNNKKVCKKLLKMN